MKTKELKKGGFGTASLTLGILGFILFPFVLSTLAIIFGALGRKDNQKYATTGLVLGVIGFVWSFFFLVILMSLFATLIASF